MSFSTLPPDSRTLVSKWKDFGPLGNSPVLLLASKTPLMTTVAKFLDTSVCGALDALTQPQSISCEVHPNSWMIFLTILIRLQFSRLVVLLFLPHFPSTQLSVNMLGYSTLWTASLAMNVCVLPSLWRCQWLSSGQLSDQQSSPWLCSLVNQTERPFWRLRKPLQVFWVDWLIACHHILICWDVNWWVFVKCEPKSSQLKEPKT